MVNSLPNVVFDLGGQFREAAGKDTVFVSHSHMDHIAAIPWHTSYRSMVKQHPATYIVPRDAKQGMLSVLSGHAQLSEKPDAMQCNLQPVTPDDMILLRKKPSKPKSTSSGGAAAAAAAAAAPLPQAATPAGQFDQAEARFAGHPSRALVIPSTSNTDAYSAAEYPHFVRIFATEHRVPSHAHVLFARRKSYPKHLLAEGDDIGTAIKEKRLLPEISTSAVLGVSGDTVIDSILQCPELCSASVLVMECTYLEDSPRTSIEKCRERGHVHLLEFARAWAAGAFTNEHILLAHMSARYAFHEAQRCVQSALSSAFEELRAAGKANKGDLRRLPQVHVHCPGAPRAQQVHGSRVKVGGGGGAAAEGSHHTRHAVQGVRGRGRGGDARGGAARGDRRPASAGGGGAGRGDRRPAAAGGGGFQRWGVKREPGPHTMHATAGEASKRARGPSEGQPQGQ